MSVSTSITVDFEANPRYFVGACDVRLEDKTVCTISTGAYPATVYGQPIAWAWTASSGTFVDATAQNPILQVASGSTATINISLTVTAPDSTTGSTTKTAYLKRFSTSPTKPSVGGTYGDMRIVLFTTTTNYKVIGLNSTSICNLFFQNLKLSNYINKVGDASFTIVDAATSTSAERAFLAANVNVAILAGDNCVWSGKIRTATQGRISPYDISSAYQTWSMECESDIVRMEMQNVKTANKMFLTASPGFIISKIVEGTSPDIDWRGYIPMGGVNISYEINDEDMYTQFKKIAKLTGYDWRTRLPVTVVDISVPTITIGTPVLDFALNLGQDYPLNTFKQNQSDVTIPICYAFEDKSDYKMISTKVVTKGKSASIVGGTVPPTITSTCVSKDKWDDNKRGFNQSTYITYTNSAYVHSIYSSTTVYIYGWDNTFRIGDHVNCINWNGGTPSWVEGTISGFLSRFTNGDGTKLTGFTLNPISGSFSSYTIPKRSVVFGTNMFVKSSSAVMDASLYYTDGGFSLQKMNVGGCIGDNQINIVVAGSGGTDAVYGKYLGIGPTWPPVNGLGAYQPHSAGTLVSNTKYTETSPETGSPINMFGVLTKTFATDQSVTTADLEVYATNYLNNHSYYYKKGSMWCLYYDLYKVNSSGEAIPLQVGDEIGVLQKTGDTINDVEFGQYKNRWQIVSYTLDANTMRVTIELGDFERNLYNLISDRTISVTETIT